MTTAAGAVSGTARRHRRAPLRAAAALCAGLSVLAGTLSGCGSEEDPDEGTNGLASEEPDIIEAQAREAAEAAETLRLAGNVIAGDSTFRLDMRVGPEGAIGEVSTETMYFELLRVDDDLYIKADAAFWQFQQSDEEGADGPEFDPAETLEDKYVVVAPDDPAYEQLSGFTDKSLLLEGLLVLDGERQTGERGEFSGLETISVLGDEGAGGLLEVSLIGTPYPLRLERGGEAGEVRMTEWDKEFTLRPPQDAQIVDYGDELLRPED